MHHERNRIAAADKSFAVLDALVDDGLCVCAIITDPEGRPTDYRFLKVNDRFEALTGLRDAVGRTALELVPELEPKWIELYGRVALDRVPLRFSETSDPMGRAFEVSAIPADPPGRFLILFRDVTLLRQAEAERMAALDHAQRLLKELGHRVMNSFAAISSIVAMEARAAPPEGRGALDRLQGRVLALAALYRRLDGAPQVDRVEVSEYLAGIVSGFRDSPAASPGMAVEAELTPLTLCTQAAVPLGLVLNELLTNAAKHAFPDGRAGTVRVSLTEEGSVYRLCVADDGAGLGEGAAGGGVGRSLVAAFVGELGGEMALDSGPNGTTVTVTFPV